MKREDLERLSGLVVREFEDRTAEPALVLVAAMVGHIARERGREQAARTIADLLVFVVGDPMTAQLYVSQVRRR